MRVKGFEEFRWFMYIYNNNYALSKEMKTTIKCLK